MKISLNTIDNISKGSGQVALYMMLVMTALVFVGVILRYVFNAPSKWIPELSQFLFGTSLLLAGAFALQQNKHIRVDVIVNQLRPRLQAILDLFASLFFWVFCVVLLYKGGEMAWHSVSHWETTGTFWNPPIWPVKIFIVLSALLILLQGVAKTIRDWRKLAALSEKGNIK